MAGIGNNGTHRGPNRDKPFRDALRIVMCDMERGETNSYPKGSLRWNAQQLLLLGEVPSIREVADRLDGKVPQAIVGDDEHPSVTPFSEWLAWMKSPADIGRESNSPPITNGHKDLPKSLPTAEPAKP